MVQKTVAAGSAVTSRKSAPTLASVWSSPSSPQSSNFAKIKAVKRKHAQNGRVAPSGATRHGKAIAVAARCAAGNDARGAQAEAASGTGRGETRMQGVFGLRRCLYAQDKQAFSNQQDNMQPPPC